MDTNIILTIAPHTTMWSIKHAIIMIISNLIAVSIGRYSIKVRGLGPGITILGLDSFGLPELLATTSLGHVIGAAAIIGLSSIGVIN
uniref:Photosystem I reaction center subunit PsaK n=1 Tax=Dicranema revolutum TaxID=239144 RepID=A0A4D6WUQ0_9FLOR|nr:photosystem I reaction center subunit X [Dicranema revolutum]